MAALPERIGKYLIDSVLGRGGMGEVYKAHDETLGRFVALKIMRGPALDDAMARERFVREAQAAGGLRHPNIVTVYDLGEVDGQLYIAMEYIKGDDLEHIIKQRRPLMIEDRLNIMIQVSEGVSYAHKNQIVHRDLKPSNIRIDDEGVVKIMDFGIAKMESSNMTASGTIMGTPYYMSPEQVRGMRVDPRSDIFSLGSILYEVFAYQKAFSGEMASVFYKIVHEPPTPLAEYMDVPSGPLQQIVDLCLAKDKNRRMQTAAELADMLREVQRGYREMNSATVIGIKADAGQQPEEYRIAPAPTAVSSSTRSRTGSFAATQGTAPPAEGASIDPAPSSFATAPPPPSTRFDPTQNLAAQNAPPPAAPATAYPPAAAAPASSSMGLKIAVLALLGLLLLGGGGAGVYYFVVVRGHNGGGTTEVDNKKLAQAKALYNSKNYDQAIQIYSDLLKDSPNDANLHFLRGAAEQKLMKSQEALLDYQTAVELDPKLERAWQQIGFILMERMDYQNAENAFNRALEINSNSGASWEGLAQIYRINQNFDKAQEAYTRLIQIEPQNINGHYNLGVILLGKQDLAGAGKAFQTVIQLNPNYAEAHNNLGMVYLKQGDPAKAVQENEIALQIKPNLASAHFQLSVAYERQGDKTSAAQHLATYLELTGDNNPELKKKLEELRP